MTFAPLSFLAVTPGLRGRSETVPADTMTDTLASPIDPWIGLIVIGVLLITGALAIIREIHIEERENRGEDS